MKDQSLPASFIVAVSVLAYGLGALSLLLLQSHSVRRTARKRAAARLPHPTPRSPSANPAVLLAVPVSLSLVALAVILTGAWATLADAVEHLVEALAFEPANTP